MEQELSEELQLRFVYHPPQDGQPEMYMEIREGARGMAYLLDRLCPKSRELSLATTALEECVFWANAAIARRS